MGLVLDSSGAVAAERQGKNAKQLLQALAFETGENEIAVSVLTLLELAHGVARANTEARHSHRYRFLQELMSVVPVHPITAAVALRAGDIDGQSRPYPAFRSSDWRNRSRTRLPNRHAQHPPLPTDP